MGNVQPTPRRQRRGLALALLALVAALAAMAPAPARAAADVNAAVATAKVVFPQVTQRCGGVRIEVGALSALNVGASAESYFSSCRVRIALSTMTTATQAQMCSLMVHEWGHLAGLEHTSDPNHFMNAMVPHNPVCGPSDHLLQARQALEDSRALRLDAINEKLSELRAKLRATRRAQRRARGAKRARLGRRAKQLERRMERLKAERRSL